MRTDLIRLIRDLFLFNSNNLHLTGCVVDREVYAIVYGDAVKHCTIRYREFHLHPLHQSDDLFVIDLDSRSLRIQRLNDSNRLVDTRLRRSD